jgi:hypothetical protein
MVKKKVKKQTMKVSVKKSPVLLFWAPRILMIIYIGLITAFALNALNNFQGLQLGLALFVKLIPSIILTIFLAIAWNWEEIGAYLFIALGFIFGIFFNAFESFSGFSFLVLPIWAIGLVFFASNKKKS